MKRVKNTIGLAAALVATLTACTATPPERTPETERLLGELRTVHQKGIMFGHHDDTMYGIGWEGDEGRSDVRSVCGDYPAVVSFDLGELELGGTESLDKVAFDKIRKEIINQYERGGIASISWHARNPLTGGDAWDVSDSTVVRSILPGGTNHAKFGGWLARVADFIGSLRTAEGVKVPVLFRPWHEHTGSWFWWGEKLCSPDEYKALWRMTADSLRARGVDNVLYAYSPGAEPRDTTQYLARYPGDDLISVVGFDTYQFDRDEYLANMERMLRLTTDVARAHDKVAAVTETGYEGVPDARWWTGTLLPAVAKYPVAYVLVWRNARERPTHFYAPYPGQVSAEDFVEFYNDPRTLFAGDI
ncbi:MAG: glycoside hydrolase family 26 protein [Mediterranea sp.]|nr:glycoside hydrolase family 26 protein [Mediterranea sp.]